MMSGEVKADNDRSVKLAKQLDLEIIKAYKEQPILWRVENGATPEEKQMAYSTIVNHCRAFYPTISQKFILKRMYYMRIHASRYHKGMKRGQSSSNSVWYYNDIKFLFDKGYAAKPGIKKTQKIMNGCKKCAKYKQKFAEISASKKERSSLKQECTVEFIAKLKRLPYLWNRVENKNTKKIELGLHKLLHVYLKYNLDASLTHVKNKINNLRNMAQKEHRRIQIDPTAQPTLWYYPLIKYMFEEIPESIGESESSDSSECPEAEVNAMPKLIHDSLLAMKNEIWTVKKKRGGLTDFDV